MLKWFEYKIMVELLRIPDVSFKPFLNTNELDIFRTNKVLELVHILAYEATRTTATVRNDVTPGCNHELQRQRCALSVSCKQCKELGWAQLLEVCRKRTLRKTNQVPSRPWPRAWHAGEDLAWSPWLLLRRWLPRRWMDAPMRHEF